MEKISAALLTYIVNAAWMVAFLAVAALLASRLLRSAPARYRHWLWVATLLLAVGLPAVNTLRSLPPRSQAAGQVTVAPLSSPPSLVDDAAPAPAASITSGPTVPHELTLPKRFARIAVILYLLLVGLRLGTLARSWLLTRSILRRSTPADFSDFVRLIVARCLERTGARNVRFLESAHVTAPLTIGISPAVVVVPRPLLCARDEAMLTSAIGHELVHVQRRDYFFNFLYRLLALPLCFHPAAALIRRRIDQTRELRCDEVVTERLLTAAAYARSLVELAGSAHALRRPATMAVGIADADILEERIMSMLKKPKLSAARRALLLTVSALVIAVPSIAAAPYALNLHVGQPILAVDSGAAPTNQAVPAEAPQARQASKPNSEVDVRARQLYAERTPGSRSQEEAGKVKAELDAAREVGFAYSGSEPQSGQEGEVRMKRRRSEEEFAKREREMSPEEREARVSAEREEMAVRARRLSELSKAAKITMQQAIDIALRQQSGTVLESNLMGTRKMLIRNADGTFHEVTTGGPGVVYRVVVLYGDENDPKRAVVLVNGIDGTVVKTETE